jgi:hypothetical protein
MSGLFIWGTGRSGSTTILEMLNLVPCISLSGENGEFIPLMKRLSTTSHALNGGGGAWLNNIDSDLQIQAQKE